MKDKDTRIGGASLLNVKEEFKIYSENLRIAL